MIRLIAGFLFAIVVIVVGHFGAWMLAANHAEDKFTAAVDALPHVNLTYDKIVPSGYPHEINIKIYDLTLRWNDLKSAKAATLRLPDVSVQTPLFDMRKAIVDLSRQFDLEIQHNKQETRHFRVVSEGAQFSSFIRPDNTMEHGFNMANLTVWDEALPQSASAVFKTGVGYVVREVPGVRSPVSWRLSVQDAKASQKLAGQPFELNRLVAVFGFDRDFFTRYGAELLQAFSSVDSTRKKAKKDLAKKLAQTKFDPHVLIDSMQIEQGKNWVSLRGAFGLNHQDYLDGRLSLNANDLSQVIGFMENIGMIQIPTTSDSRTLSRKIHDVGDDSMTIIFERDRAYINNTHITSSPSLREFLKQD